MQLSFTLLAALALPLLTYANPDPITGDVGASTGGGSSIAGGVAGSLAGAKTLPCDSGNDTCLCSHAET